MYRLFGLILFSNLINISNSIPIPETLEIGIDSIRTTVQNKSYGDKKFKYTPNHFSAYLNAQFEEQETWFELGFEGHKRAKQTVDFAVGEVRYETRVDVPQTYDMTFKAQHPYIALTRAFEYRIPNLRLLATFGLTYSTIYAKEVLVRYNNRAPTQSEQAENYQNFKSHKILPMVRLGIRYNIMDEFGVRVTWNWKNASHFQDQSDHSTNPVTLKLRNQYGFGFGVFYGLI